MDATGGVEPESGPAGKDKRVDLLHGALRRKEIGLARTWSATADIDSGDGRLIEQYHADARTQARAIGITDLQAHDVRDQIERTGFGCLILTVREHPATAQRHKRQGGLQEQRST